MAQRISAFSLALSILKLLVELEVDGVGWTDCGVDCWCSSKPELPLVRKSATLHRLSLSCCLTLPLCFAIPMCCFNTASPIDAMFNRQSHTPQRAECLSPTFLIQSLNRLSCSHRSWNVHFPITIRHPDPSNIVFKRSLPLIILSLRWKLSQEQNAPFRPRVVIKSRFQLTLSVITR